MKIIGTTTGGYLAEISETEIANAMGYGGSHYSDWQAVSKSWRDQGQSHNMIKIGTALNIAGQYDLMGRITRSADDVKKNAEGLQALAKVLIDTAARLIPPPEPAPAAEAAPASEGA